ncbi:MAG: PCP reductase family protein, partial [bacterium]
QFWTGEAKKALQTVPSGHLRRRARTRIEKVARVRKLTKITRELVLEMADDPPGDVGESENKTLQNKKADPETPVVDLVSDGDFLWTKAARQRLLRVPEGFMRDTARDHIEKFARQQKLDKITFELAEQGIAQGRKMMAAAIPQFGRDKKGPKLR